MKCIKMRVKWIEMRLFEWFSNTVLYLCRTIVATSPSSTIKSWIVVYCNWQLFGFKNVIHLSSSCQLFSVLKFFSNGSCWLKIFWQWRCHNCDRDHEWIGAWLLRNMVVMVLPWIDQPVFSWAFSPLNHEWYKIIMYFSHPKYVIFMQSKLATYVILKNLSRPYLS